MMLLVLAVSYNSCGTDFCFSANLVNPLMSSDFFVIPQCKGCIIKYQFKEIFQYLGTSIYQDLCFIFAKIVHWNPQFYSSM